jgi:ubiquinone/menaquinone biosynthesis C-methylase UbiE
MQPQIDPPAYRPRRFQGAAAPYERFRLAYPKRLIARLAALMDLKEGDAVLDLGSGPGFLAVPFAQAGLNVTAADPEPDMLDAAAAAAESAGVALQLWQGGSFDLTAAMGPYRLVAIGRAFHWMDRAATLAMLDRIVTADGAVALFHDAHPDVEENRWFKVMCEVSRRYRRQLSGSREGGHRRYEPFLFASAFRQIDGLSVTVRQPLTEDEIVGRAFSQSAALPQMLGDRARAFEVDLRAALQLLSPEGRFTEIAEMVAVAARRPQTIEAP